MTTLEQALGALGATGWAILGEATYQNIQWQNGLASFTEAEINAKIAELEASFTPKPQPLNFREKLYGLADSSPANTLYHQVYIPVIMLALNPVSANAALTTACAILEGSFWNKPFNKMAFSNINGSGSFDILKNFLTPEQITTFTANAEEFHLL
jgi:hypothetical protein